MHQANSNRNSADENSSKWVDFSVVSVTVPTEFARTLWIFWKTFGNSSNPIFPQRSNLQRLERQSRAPRQIGPVSQQRVRAALQKGEPQSFLQDRFCRYARRRKTFVKNINKHKGDQAVCIRTHAAPLSRFDYATPFFFFSSPHAFVLSITGFRVYFQFSLTLFSFLRRVPGSVEAAGKSSNTFAPLFPHSSSGIRAGKDLREKRAQE